MKKFIVTYHNSPEAMVQMSKATPEQKAEGMKPWMAWKAKHEDNILDFGAPLMGGQRVFSGGKTEPSSKKITGYSRIQANSTEEALAILANHPHHNSGPDAGVELHECVSM